MLVGLWAIAVSRRSIQTSLLTPQGTRSGRSEFSTDVGGFGLMPSPVAGIVLTPTTAATRFQASRSIQASRAPAAPVS